jgi:hypothetical protein
MVCDVRKMVHVSILQLSGLLDLFNGRCSTLPSSLGFGGGGGGRRQQAFLKTRVVRDRTPATGSLRQSIHGEEIPRRKRFCNVILSIVLLLSKGAEGGKQHFAQRGLLEGPN